ncbi:MAG TPA: glucosamine-6-phosphate deaminase [Mucilaginibacter sp.]|nr:glucosamine-6-phosphate deaminase [Mucilaginibacter sp.]
MKEFKVDRLDARIYDTRLNMGVNAAGIVARKIVDLLTQKPFINIIFAAAPSQNEFLAALVEDTTIDWTRVNAFHMDEYIGLPENAPQWFGSFLKEKIFGHLPFHSVSYINGKAAPELECVRYAKLLAQFPPDIVCMGIGENGHIAFNDPHLADFNDPLMVKVVDLDQPCRQQQVNDGCFDSLDEVPTHAITLTVPALMSGKYIYCMVPGKNKARAVHETLYERIGEQCPASVLRKHPNAVLFLDEGSANQLIF